ncbi:asparagine synthase [Halobacteriales archaeon QS_8_69_26]|nr:MAG: asparagine synthase [Halobacteriales archaeon QS_8_69_26]
MEEATLVGPGWTAGSGVAVRGRAFDGRDREADLRSVFEGLGSLREVAETADRLGGFFAAVVDVGDAVVLACDHAGSIPLYFTSEDPLRVGDCVSGFPGLATEEFDPVAASEFALTRYVTRGETLLPAVRSVRAGEAVRVPREDPAGFERRRYARYRPTNRSDGDREDLLDRMGDVLGRVFDRAESLAGGRPVAVPLSGGVDSRLVATMLVERGVEVVAFSFGVHGHADVEVARDVADALGIRFEAVEYSTDRWHDWYHSADRRAYSSFAFDYDSLPFLAEWPAVRELLADGRLPRDALVLPGHTVATPSERVPAAWTDGTPDREDVVEYVLDRHYSLWEWDDPAFRSDFADRIAADADLGPVASGPEAAAAYEGWEWTTRMATFTNSDARVYDWFDLEWWLPLWDPEYVAFWASVPLDHRRGKALQTEFATRKYAAVAGVDHEEAERTDADWTPFDQVRRTQRTDPVRAATGDFDDWLGAQSVPRSRWEEWGNYPLGWYGAIPEAAADRFAAAPTLYSLRTLSALGLLSFDPPAVTDPPLSSTVELPPTE